MKKIIPTLFCAIIIFFTSCSVRKEGDLLKKVKVAVYDKKEYSFIIDTLSYKKQIAKKIFSENSNVTFDRVEICKAFTIGKYQEEYFFIKLSDFKKNIIVVKYVTKIKNSFFLTNYSNFELLYVTCVGSPVDCSPNLFINDDLEKTWICSDKVESCSTDSLNCRIFKSIISE